MNKSEFIELLEKPVNFDSERIENIQKLVQEFPYFQSSQLLLTKAFHSSENFNFEQQLRKTAAYAADRKILHELLFNDTKIIEEDQLVVGEQSGKEVLEQDINIESPTEIFNEGLEDKPSIGLVNLEEEILKDENNLEGQIENDKDHINENALEQQILASAINNSILLEVSDEIDLNDFPVQNSISEDVKVIIEAENTGDSFDESASHSFSGWLSHFKDEESEKPIWESEKEAKKVKSIVLGNNQLPVKQEFYSPAKMAKLSVQDNDDLITETLANIYADQGNYEKAIKSFEKLQLKYPEKKIYFAGRIKEIEIQLNTL